MSYRSGYSEQGADSRSNSKKTNIKCVVVGDATVGKTSLARRLACLGFASDYDPTTFDNYAVSTTMDGKSYVISLFDTAGQEEFGHLRTLSYVTVDVFLLCFSVAAPESFAHAQEKWISEIRQHSPNTPIILVGTQIDLRDEAPPINKKGNLVSPKDINISCPMSKIRPTVCSNGPKDMNTQLCKGPVFVSTRDGLQAATKLEADSYVECSSVTEAGISRLREAAIESGLRISDSEVQGGCHCACAVM